MNKKKLLCVFLILCLLFTAFFPAYASAKEYGELTPVTLSLYSNLTSDTYITGLYSDNTFFVTLETLGKLTGGTTSEGPVEGLIIFGNGIRRIFIRPDTQDIGEVRCGVDYEVPVPSIWHNDKIYVSALHFLNYIGATVHLDENAPIQFMVIKRYDIFDVLGDLKSTSQGNFFWWDEVDISDNELVAAGVVALINRDSNAFRMMLDANGIAQEAMEDAVLSIVRNEGQAYFDENENVVLSELIDTASGIIGAEADWIYLANDAYRDTTQLGNLADTLAVASSLTSNVVEAAVSLTQFDNMTAAQKDLLSKTILQHSEDSSTLCNGWEIIYDAAETVDSKIQSKYAHQYSAAQQLAESTAYDFLNGVTGSGNPVMMVWNGVNLLTDTIPFATKLVEGQEKLYNAYNCSFVQLIAQEMLNRAYSDWYYFDAIYVTPEEQYDDLDAIKSLLILQLKSTLTTREYLIDSGYLDAGEISKMKEMNRETAVLLNKAENCKVTVVDRSAAEYDEDISWLADYDDQTIPMLEAAKAGLDYADQTINGILRTSSFPNEYESKATEPYLTDLIYDFSPGDSLGSFFSHIDDFDRDGQKELLTFDIEDDDGYLQILWHIMRYNPREGIVRERYYAGLMTPLPGHVIMRLTVCGQYIVVAFQYDEQPLRVDSVLLYLSESDLTNESYFPKDGKFRVWTGWDFTDYNNSIAIYDLSDGSPIVEISQILDPDLYGETSRWRGIIETPDNIISHGYQLTGSLEGAEGIDSIEDFNSRAGRVLSQYGADFISMIPTVWENRWDSLVIDDQQSPALYGTVEISVSPSEQVSDTDAVSDISISTYSSLDN